MFSGLNSEARKIGTYIFAVDCIIIPDTVVIAKRQSVFLNVVPTSSLCGYFSNRVKSKKVYLKIGILIVVSCTPAPKAKVRKVKRR